MAVNTSQSRSAILARLRTLRTNLAQARDALMHFKTDRVDRDKLEPAARRVDDLMNLFAGDLRDTLQGSVWIGEIQRGLEQVSNPKSADALSAARQDIVALLEAMGDGGSPARASQL